QAEVRGELGLDAPDPGWNPTNPGLVDGHGWRARTDAISEEYRRKTTEMALSQYDEFCASAQLGAEAVQALEALLAQCRREAIPVSVVLMPEGPPFRALYSPEARAALDGLLARLEPRWA